MPGFFFLAPRVSPFSFLWTAMTELSPDTRAIIAALRETKGDVDRKMDEMINEVKELRRGFPDGDPDAHRRYHETVIEWRETRNLMVKAALMHAAKVGGVAGAGWVLYALWTALKMEITQ